MPVVNSSYTVIVNNGKVIITIRQQDLRKFIDLNMGKKFIQVFTTYGYSGSTAIAGTQYDYEVEWFLKLNMIKGWIVS